MTDNPDVIAIPPRCTRGRCCAKMLPRELITGRIEKGEDAIV